MLCRVTCFTWNTNPRPATSRGETIHFNPYLLRLNYPTVFHVKPLPDCIPTKPTFHVKHRTPLYDAYSNPPCFTWNMENLVQTSRNITLTSHDCQATQPTLWGTGEQETGWQTLSQFSAYLHAPPIPRNKPYGFQRICGIRANAFYIEKPQMQRILSTKMPMFHVKHLSLFKAVCGDDYVDG